VKNEIVPYIQNVTQTWLFLECGQPNIGHAIVSSFNGTVMKATCLAGYVPETVTLHCLENGTWIRDDICKFQYGKSELI
jgi:hypothetical protein